MSFSFSDFSSALKAGAAISPEDVLAIRRAVWPDGAVARGEAGRIFELHRLARDSGREWSDFFIEAITDTIVNAAEPKGYVDDESAAWLIGEIEKDGRPIDATEIELVVKIIEKSLNAPAALKAWALARVERSVLEGDGAVVDEAEVGWLRRLIFASGGDGALVVSQEEAEMLWRIKDATLGAANAPGWKTLFVQAVGNHLMAWSSYRPLEREEAARLETFMNDRRSDVLGFLSRMGRPDFEAAKRVFEPEESAAGHEAAVDAAEAVTPSENAWLQSLVSSDGKRDEYEEALIRFLESEGALAPR
jgi:hypothetical protein